MTSTVPALGRMAMTAVTAIILALVVGALVAPASAVVVVGDTPAPSWRVDGRVYAVEIVGNRVFVGGAFTTATSPGGASVPRSNLAAFDVRTGEVLPEWRADASSTVRALDSDSSGLYVGGAFGRVADRTRSRLAKVDLATGAVNPRFAPRVNNVVRALDVDGGHVYVGGLFTAVGRRARSHLAKLETATGRVDRRFVASADEAVWGVVKNPSSRDLYVSGLFSEVNGASRSGVAAVSSRRGNTREVVFRSSARPTFGLAVNASGSRLFTAGGTRENAVAAWRTTTGARIWRQVAMGDVQAIEYYRGSVYFGFHDGFAGDSSLKVLAADAATGALDPQFRPSFDRFWGVFAIDVTDDALAVGGEFRVVSGVPAEGLARFLPSAGGGRATGLAAR